jgi:hypothetical protein
MRRIRAIVFIDSPGGIFTADAGFHALQSVTFHFLATAPATIPALATVAVATLIARPTSGIPN